MSKVFFLNFNQNSCLILLTHYIQLILIYHPITGNPIVDETGTPLQVEEEEIPNLLNTIASSLTAVDVHQQKQMVGQPMDVGYVDPTTGPGQYVQQLPTSLVPSVPTMGQFTQPNVFSQ